MGSTYYVDPAAGGANNGTSWGDAWTSLQSAADTAVAGDITYCRGTQSLSAAARIDFDTNSGTAAGGWIKFIGCNAGGTVDGTRFVLDGGGDSTNDLIYISKSLVWFENIDCYDSNDDGWYINGYHNAFINCAAHTSDGYGFKMLYGLQILIDCESYSNGSYGFYSAHCCRYVGCNSRLNAGHGIYDADSESVIINCIAYGNTAGNGIHQNSNRSLCAFCTCADNSADGYSLGTGDYNLVIGVRATGNGSFGINFAGAASMYGYCYIPNGGEDEANTGGIVENNSPNAEPLVIDGTDTNDIAGTDANGGYNDPASNDFNLVSTATLVREEMDIGT